MLDKLNSIVEKDPAIEQVVSLRAVYTGPEEVIVAAKIRPSTDLTIEELTRAMDDLDHKIRAALPFVADVFIDVTRSRSDDESAAPSVSPGKG